MYQFIHSHSGIAFHCMNIPQFFTFSAAKLHLSFCQLSVHCLIAPNSQFLPALWKWAGRFNIFPLSIGSKALSRKSTVRHLRREVLCFLVLGTHTSVSCRPPGRFDPWFGKIPPEKEMATHSSILAWRIPCTEEPRGLQSSGSQRVRHDWSESARMRMNHNRV